MHAIYIFDNRVYKYFCNKWSLKLEIFYGESRVKLEADQRNNHKHQQKLSAYWSLLFKLLRVCLLVSPLLYKMTPELLNNWVNLMNSCLGEDLASGLLNLLFSKSCIGGCLVIIFFCYRDLPIFLCYMQLAIDCCIWLLVEI